MSDIYFYLILAFLSIVIVTISSIANSNKYNEDKLPKSIINVIVNLIIITITFFTIIYSIPEINIEQVQGYSLVFYWLLILISRFNIPEYIKFLWVLSFILWIFSTIINNQYIKEFMLIILWFSHILIAIKLTISNNKNG